MDTGRPLPHPHPRPGQRESLRFFCLARATELKPRRITGGGQGVGVGVGVGAGAPNNPSGCLKGPAAENAQDHTSTESEGLSRINMLAIQRTLSMQQRRFFFVCFFFFLFNQANHMSSSLPPSLVYCPLNLMISLARYMKCRRRRRRRRRPPPPPHTHTPIFMTQKLSVFLVAD